VSLAPHSLFVAFSLAACLALVGCRPANPAAADGDTLEQLTVIAREIADLIGAAVCESDDQCRVIALGSKPCGGPAEYRVYSSLDTDAGLLETRASEYTRLSVQYNRETKALSDCSMVLAPMAYCASGQCKTAVKRPTTVEP
jgi:hypothetical protein